MYKKEYKGLDTDKFTDELQQSGLLDKEMIHVLFDEEKTILLFSEINEKIVVEEETEYITTTYWKEVGEITTVVVDDIEIQKPITKRIDYTTEFEKLLAEIQLIADAHDPTPTPQPKTELEILREAVDQLILDSLVV